MGINQAWQQQGGADSCNTLYGGRRKEGGCGDFQNKGTRGGIKSRTKNYKVVGDKRTATRNRNKDSDNRTPSQPKDQPLCITLGCDPNFVRKDKSVKKRHP